MSFSSPSATNSSRGVRRTAVKSPNENSPVAGAGEASTAVGLTVSTVDSAGAADSPSVNSLADGFFRDLGIRWLG